MTTQQLARDSYKNSQKELASDKAIELRVFASITSRLRAADIDKIGGMTELAEAITDNVKLWNILLIDLSNPENPLPLDLKKSIISLAEFTQAHSLKVLAGLATHGVLIDINQSMINGLRTSLLGDFPQEVETEAA